MAQDEREYGTSQQDCREHEQAALEVARPILEVTHGVRADEATDRTHRIDQRDARRGCTAGQKLERCAVAARREHEVREGPR